MESTGDPCQAYVEELAYWGIEVGLNIKIILPESIASCGDDNLLRDLIKNAQNTLRKDGWGAPDPVAKVAQFLAGGPRPLGTG